MAMSLPGKNTCSLSQVTHVRAHTALHRLRSRRQKCKRENSDSYERPDGLNAEEQEEWDAMMENPVLHDLFYGMGSSGQSGGERPETAPGMYIRI